jgi:hypothetical protein
MKSAGINMGSVNLKGKKTKRLRCGCCTAQDFREREMERAGLKQIRDFDIGNNISEETLENIKAIDNNTKYAMMNAHKMWCD